MQLKYNTMELENIKIELTNFFNDITFLEEEHTYFSGEVPLIPVTNYIKSYVKPFDRMGNAKRVAAKRGLPIETILAEWDKKRDDACDKGNGVHKFAELYTKDSVPTTPYEHAVAQFFKDIPDFIVPVFGEFKMYSVDYKLAGTVDKLFYNTLTNKFLVIDYKTNEDLDKNFQNQKLLYPFNSLLDTPFNKYQLQLSLYQILFELTGNQVERRRVVWFKEDGTYQVRDTNDYTKLLKQLLTC